MQTPIQKLLVWTHSPSTDVIDAIGHVLNKSPEVEVSTCIDYGAAANSGASTILCLGPSPLEVMGAAGVIPKNRTISSLRGTLFKAPDCDAKMLFSYAVGIGKVDYSKFVDLQCDVGSALRVAKTGKLEPEYGDYKYVEDFTDFIKEVEALYAATGKRVRVALDLETLGLDWLSKGDMQTAGAYIICIQVSHTEGKSSLVYFPNRQAECNQLQSWEFAEQIDWLLNSPKVKLTGANLKYDLNWLGGRWGFTCSNFTFDTTLVGSVLDENRSNGLDVHAKIYCPLLGGYSDHFDKTVDKSRMDKVPKDAMLLYAGGDSDATLRVSNVQEKELIKDKALTSFYVNILHPAARAFEMVEQGGMLVDLNAYKQVEADLNTELLMLVQKAKGVIGGRLVAKHGDLDKPGGMNLTKASLLKDFMFSPSGLNLKPKVVTAKTKEPSTALEHLMMFKDVPEAAPFIELLSDYSSASKTLTTYVTGFLKHLRSDGRFHPSFWFFAGRDDEDNKTGTNTGRLSAKNPAFQCMVGETLVTTNEGEKRLDWLVENNGAGLKVLTHTGSWRDIVGVYRNGIRPTYRVTLKSGHTIDCTGNHPLLTRQGWVKTEDLVVQYHQAIISSGGLGGKIHASTGVSRVPDFGIWTTDMQSVLQQKSRKARQFGEEWVSGTYPFKNKRVARKETCTPISGSTFSSPEREVYDRDTAFGWESYKQPLEELEVGNVSGKFSGHGGSWAFDSGIEESKCQISKGVDSTNLHLSSIIPSGGCSKEIWDFEDHRVQDKKWGSLGFEVVDITSIEIVGERETFDLTIDSCHSFVANGVVVHNTLPKHTKWAKALRRCYPAPPGMLMMERDYSQGELKVIACLANEEAMIEAYLNDMDLHSLTAGGFEGYSYEDMLALKKSNKELYAAIRQLGKAGNFGLIYGMGVDGFYVYATTNYGVKDFTLEKAADFRTGFFNRYPGLLDYHAQQKAVAKAQGLVRSPLGRIRHLPLINSGFSDVRSKAERQSINSPTQGTLSDMVLWTAGLEHKSGYTKACPMFGATHDAAYSYVPEDDYEKYARIGIETMENLPFHLVGWEPQLKFTADLKIGKDMASLEEIHF